jgi:chromatin segregation and condensation protein Rec8/ScpA/Scc1 (kleisin family)
MAGIDIGDEGNEDEDEDDEEDILSKGDEVEKVKPSSAAARAVREEGNRIQERERERERDYRICTNEMHCN